MIVKMRHLDLVCLAGETDKALASLGKLGAVHLDFGATGGEGVEAARSSARDAEKAVRLILKTRGKRRLEELEIRPHTVAEVMALETDRATLIEERDRLEREITKFSEFGDFDPELASDLLAKVQNLRDYVSLPEELPAMRLSKMREKLMRVENRIRIDNEKIAGCDEKVILENFPQLKEAIAFESARELIAREGALASISGWVPETRLDDLRRAAAENGWATLVREPMAGEEPPTLVEPPRLFKPMKALFDGLGIAPGYEETDVSVPFMVYFSLFFAMLVGDGAYGMIFLIATMVLGRKLPKSWFVLLTVFSSATVLWGLLSNTWFGAAIPWCADWPTVRWLADPSYHHMMLLCFTIGVSHLTLARVWNGVCRLNSLDCLPEFGWAGVLVFMYLVTNAVVGIFSGIPTWGFWLLGVSLVLIVTRTRGAALGMLPLNVMSSLGDIISYVRLFAVGLASVKVAENFNAMATGLVTGDNAWWLKAVLSIAMVAILLVGHALNLAMAGLSILVHAVRLNTLEFSNHKGISWSGHAYRPFVKK